MAHACILITALLSMLVMLAMPGQSALPCNHPLRLSAPYLFKHCTSTPSCTYSAWKTVPNSVRTVSTSQCASGKTYQEKRTSSSSSCPTQTKRICLPDQEDRLILALGLGSSGKNLKPVSKKPSSSIFKNIRYSFRRVRRIRKPLPPPVFYRPKCPKNHNVGRICHHLAGKRSAPLTEEFSPAEPFEETEDSNSDTDATIEKREATGDSNSDADTPVQFEWNEHGPRLRRHVQQCSPHEVQHVLFVLDSSGSIGTGSYKRMKDAIGKLVPLFCKQVQFAMVTFSTNINLEFCFDCFDNTYSGREEAKKAISKAKYHAAWTNTGATTKCICEQLLSTSCGISSAPSCLDVVYITDGKSNDHRHQSL